MTDPILASLRAYWETVRKGGLAPFRADIDPRGFEGALGNLFIVERLEQGVMRLRLAGLAVCEMAGMELRGMAPGVLFAPQARPMAEDLLERVMREPAIVELTLVADGSRGSFQANMLLMPLRSDLGEINRVLGCVSGAEQIFAPPLVFRIVDSQVSPIRETTTDISAPETAGFAEEATPFLRDEKPALKPIDGNPSARDQPRDRRRRGRHLRIVD